ncbi:MAG: hypothetical protein ACE5JM_17210 [Armatimonadota bacterium]
MSCINEEAVTRLQREIDNSLAERRGCGVERIRLDHGSEVTDLTRGADVRVYLSDRAGFRLFSFLTIFFLDHVLSSDLEGHPRPDVRDLYAAGGPLIVTREVSGDVIVRGVLRYLELEKGRHGV